MRRAARTAAALAAAGALVAGLTGCGMITNLISGEDDVFTLAVGDCWDNTEANADAAEVSSVPTVDCEKKHDFEAYSAMNMDDKEYPGLAETEAEADQYCMDKFEGFLGLSYEEAVAYDFTYFYPSDQSWGLGDREILCTIYAIDENGEIEKVTGSLKGAEG